VAVSPATVPIWSGRFHSSLRSKDWKHQGRQIPEPLVRSDGAWLSAWFRGKFCKRGKTVPRKTPRTDYPDNVGSIHDLASDQNTGRQTANQDLRSRRGYWFEDLKLSPLRLVGDPLPTGTCQTQTLRGGLTTGASPRTRAHSRTSSLKVQIWGTTGQTRLPCPVV
jgi:hypothetical protein